MNDRFILETKSIWSFPQRGNWGTHKGDYRGNWSPYVPKNVILRYSREGDLILDQFVGSGTTLIEAEAANRRCIGCDINESALAISRQRIVNKSIPLLKIDARKLTGIEDNSIDLICTHPPYAGIIKYSKDIKEDISLMNINEFYNAMVKVSEECFRVLKKGKYCAIMMGDIRQNGYIVPLAFNVMNIFIKTGFKLKEIVIKEQHNCKSTEYWAKISIERNFLLIAHEYLFVFHKS